MCVAHARGPGTPTVEGAVSNTVQCEFESHPGHPARFRVSVRVMRLVIDIDMDAVASEVDKEIARILRYWAGALPQMELTPGTDQVLMDSTYATVGHLRISD
jgi:hypothetical protein